MAISIQKNYNKLTMKKIFGLFIYKIWGTILLVLLSFYNEECSAQSSEKILIADSLMDHPNLESILDLPYFKNKVVLVDFWYTSCSPCIREFSSVPELKDRFKGKGLEFLYICVPTTQEWDKANEETWRRLIDKYGLQGVNIKVTNDFSEHFWESKKDKISEDLSYAYPTYLLVNKQGGIINFNAPRPSKKEILYTEIERLLLEN